MIDLRSAQRVVRDSLGRARDRRCARWWFLRGMYIGMVAGWVDGVGPRVAELETMRPRRVRFMLDFWRRLGWPSSNPEGK